MWAKSGLKRTGLPSKQELLGLAILSRGSQISRINDKLFLVKSQCHTVEQSYKVKWKAGRWTCQCPGRTKRGRACEHTHAVNQMLKLPQLILSNQQAIEGACPFCGSNEIILKG